MKFRELSISLGGEAQAAHRPANWCVGAGRAYEGLRADWQAQIRRCAKECGFQAVRFHGIFHDDMGVYREDARTGAPVYDFHQVDVLYDALLEAGIRPFVELGFMPSAMASGEKTVFWWKANVTPPKDHGLWEELIEHFVRHLVNRYGMKEVSTWFFEVWNEPDHPGFFTTRLEDYLALYRASARGVLRVLPAAQIGGPASAHAVWTRELIEFCRAEGLPLAFISVHSYGVEGCLDEFGVKQTHMQKDPASVTWAFRKVREDLKAAGMPDLPVHVTEWGPSYTPRDPVHDHYFAAAFLAQKIKEASPFVTSLSHWTFTDIFEEPGPPAGPFHGGFGLLNVHGLRKPAFHLHAFLNALGPVGLETGDPMSFATKAHDSRAVQILLWDFAMPDQDSPNQTYFRRELPPACIAKIPVSITGLRPGQWEMTITRVGCGSNDVLGEYLKIGAPSNLTREELDHLHSVSDGSPEQEEFFVVGPDGRATREITLRTNDVVFVDIREV